MATAGVSVRLPVDLTVEGDLVVNGNLPSVPRSSLTQDTYQIYPLSPLAFREHNAIATFLPATSSGAHLGIYGDTFGTNTPYIATSDLKAAGATTRYARALFCLPPEYVAGQTVRTRISGGMKTTVADTSATVDVECYKSSRDSLKTGSDLVTTSAQSINSLTFADKNFDMTFTGLAPGDWLDIRLTVAVTDAATGTAVIAALGAVEVLCHIKG